MVTNNTISLNLEPFGDKGQVILSAPTFRRFTKMKNDIGNRTKVVQKDGKAEITEPNVGDVEVLGILVYVKEAPFPTDLDGFYNYCDHLDEQRLGSAMELCTAMRDIISDIDAGKFSPLEDSAQQATQNSD